MTDAAGHGRMPSQWVTRHLSLLPPRGVVLDVACGGGRHARLLLDRGFGVVGVDRDIAGVADIASPDFTAVEADLEGGEPWPFHGRRFDGVVVTNYLHRPLLPALVAAVAPSGAFIYETFAVGNERHGRPRNPDFLLHSGELIDAVRGRLRILAYEDVTVSDPKPACKQRIAAVNMADRSCPSPLERNEP